MEDLKKIFTEEHFVFDQFLLLKKTQNLAKEDKVDEKNLRTIYNSAFSAILLMGYPATVLNDTILSINGSVVGLDDYSFNANIEELKANEPAISDRINAILNGGEFTFTTDVEKERLKEEAMRAEEEANTSEEVANATKEAEEAKQAEVDVHEAEFEPVKEEKPVIQENNDLFEEESEPEPKFKYAYDLNDEPEELTETPEMKYYDTMWMYKSHIVCENADRSKGIGRKEFDILLIPIEIPLANKKQLPLRHIAVIYNKNDDLYKFELPGPSAFGIIAYEDYEFMHNIRFNPNGEMVSTINIKDKEKYIIVENDDTVIYHSGTCVPKHFGKFIDFGTDTLELFPLYDTNSEKKGIVSCLAIHKKSNGEEVATIEKDVILCPINEGKENKQITPFWDTENSTKVLKVYI